LRVVGCLGVGAIGGGVTGFLLGWLYDSLLMHDPGVFKLRGLIEIELAFCFGVLGALTGAIVGLVGAGKLGATIIGMISGVVFVLCWSFFVIAIPEPADFALMGAALLMMGLVGWIEGIVFRFLSARITIEQNQ